MSYSQPLASTTKYGAVKVGTGLSVTNGVISTNGTSSSIYGFFYDTTIQTNPVANAINTITWNTTGTANLISRNGGNQLTVTNAGVYSKSFTLSLAKTTSGQPTVTDVWLRYNGVDVTDSRQQIAVPNQLSALFITGSYTLNMAAGSTLSMCWSSPDTTIQLQSAPATVGPIRPSIPSAKITLTKIG